MIIGASKAIESLLEVIGSLVHSPAPVLVVGEPGTERDLVARALHYCGPRASAPFIAVNCTAFPDSFFDSGIFAQDRGTLQAAQKATIFLDEAADVPLEAQEKIVQLIDRGVVAGPPVPGERLRVVAATVRSLDAEVQARRFRDDLHRRLGMNVLRVPSIRERPEDIPPLVNHNLTEIARRANRSVPRLSAAALQRLLSHGWPGNLRELVACLERAFLLAGDRSIEAEHILIEDLPGPNEPPIMPYREAKQRFEAEYYSRLMRTAGGNISLAARLAQKTRKEVYDALKRLGHHPLEYRPSSDDDLPEA